MDMALGISFFLVPVSSQKRSISVFWIMFSIVLKDGLVFPVSISERLP